jgi:UDP-N-acetylglucosamine 2-epimerase (non-hydrolysing)
MNKIRAACIVGARPNFIKMASLLNAMSRRPEVWEPVLIHTGQHYSQEMSQSFFDDLGLPQPDEFLGLGGGSQTQQTAEMMKALEGVFLRRSPNVVIVVGDVNSTLAAALVSTKLGIPLAHVEAGLRSRDRRMPEEINRLTTDAVSDFLFASETTGRDHLLSEGVDPGRVFFVGNTMIDTLLRFREKAMASPVLERLALQPGLYALVTLHRPSNVDDPAQLRNLITVLEELAQQIPVVFPLHPRTQQRLEPGWIQKIRVVPPQGYLDFLRLMSQARLILTDSVGIQEESTVLGVPCLTMRENTERPATLHSGTNRLIGVDPGAIRQAAHEILAAPPLTNPRCPELWDGLAAGRILDVLERSLGQARDH